jgi:dTDP-4-amino-4,6-dideoxygalactose transaminase
LTQIEAWIAGRRNVARRYDRLIEEQHLHGIMQRPVVKPYGRHTFNQYVVRVPAAHRDGLVQHLKKSQIGCEVYYPLSLHLQECIRYLGHGEGDFPESESASRSVLALPMFPEMTEEQQLRVVSTCGEYLRSAVRTLAA